MSDASEGVVPALVVRSDLDIDAFVKEMNADDFETQVAHGGVVLTVQSLNGPYRIVLMRGDESPETQKEIVEGFIEVVTAKKERPQPHSLTYSEWVQAVLDELRGDEPQDAYAEGDAPQDYVAFLIDELRAFGGMGGE